VDPIHSTIGLDPNRHRSGKLSTGTLETATDFPQELQMPDDRVAILADLNLPAPSSRQ